MATLLCLTMATLPLTKSCAHASDPAPAPSGFLPLLPPLSEVPVEGRSRFAPGGSARLPSPGTLQILRDPAGTVAVPSSAFARLRAVETGREQVERRLDDLDRRIRQARLSDDGSLSRLAAERLRAKIEVSALAFRQSMLVAPAAPAGLAIPPPSRRR